VEVIDIIEVIMNKYNSSKPGQAKGPGKKPQSQSVFSSQIAV
jgi:hypothetical protein